MDSFSGKSYLIANQPLFKDLKDSDKRFIADLCQMVDYKPGEIIYEKGTPRDFFYIIASGSVQSFIPGEGTQAETYIETHRKGEYFGLLSLLADRPHSISVRAAAETRLLRMDERSFDDALKRIPELAISITRILSRRIRIDAAGTKEIIQSNITGILSAVNADHAAQYATELAHQIETESGKRVLVLTGASLSLNFAHIQEIQERNFGKLEESLHQSASKIPYILLVLPPIGEAPEWYYTLLDHLVILYADESEISAVSEIQHGSALAMPPTEDYVQIVRAPLDFDSVLSQKAIKQRARTMTGMRIGLSLGGGAAFGLAQIGLLKVLERQNIFIDMVTGTSMGALIGCLWASGLKADSIAEASREFDSFFKVVRLMDITIPTSGLIGGRRIRDFLNETLHGKRFEDFETPALTMACDIARREEVVIGTGPAVDGIMASIAIPGLFNPILPGDGRILVDGGMVNPLPVNLLSREGINRIVAVNSMPSPEAAARSSGSTSPNVLDILLHSFYSLQYRIARYAIQDADIYMNPIMEGSTWYDFHRAPEFIDFGEEEAEKIVPEFLQLARKS